MSRALKPVAGQFDTHKADPSGVKRYWPGKAPEWYKEDDELEDEDEEGIKVEDEEEEDGDRAAVAPPVIIKRPEDARLQRLAVKVESDDEGEDYRNVTRARILSRRARDAEAEQEEEEEQEEEKEFVEGDVQVKIEQKEEPDEDEDELQARRAAVRERLKRKEEEVLLPEEEEEDEGEESEEESEYETDSEDEMYGRQLLKPVFVPKHQRETIDQRAELELEELRILEHEKLRLHERKKETREIVANVIEMEEKSAKAAAEGPRDIGDVDTDDDKGPEEEEAQYLAWQEREKARIKRDRELREKEKKELEEKEKIRNMSEAERRLYALEKARENAKPQKEKWRFLQKYWHKGAFFQVGSDNPTGPGDNADEIYTRDYSAPTGEDKMDKTVLPKVMQVKNFGRRGQTKWTHLLDQDTTAMPPPPREDGTEDPQMPPPRKERRLAGTDDVFEKPRKFRT